MLILHVTTSNATFSNRKKQSFCLRPRLVIGREKKHNSLTFIDLLQRQQTQELGKR